MRAARVVRHGNPTEAIHSDLVVAHLERYFSIDHLRPTGGALTYETLRPGLAFMTLHFPDQVATNVLTLDTWDPKSGTAEFKATAIRVDKPGTTSMAGQSLPAEVEA